MSHASTARHASNVGNFRELVEFCAAMDPARYHPVRLNLKIKSLQKALAAAEECLARVEATHAEPASTQVAGAQAQEPSLEALNVALYATGEGIVDLANDCKTYLRSIKGAKEENLHHITHLEFRAPG